MMEFTFLDDRSPRNRIIEKYLLEGIAVAVHLAVYVSNPRVPFHEDNHPAVDHWANELSDVCPIVVALRYIEFL